MAQITKFLQIAHDHRASDVHFVSGEPVRVRIDGDLVPLGEQSYSHGDLETILYEILSDEERSRFAEQKNLDKSYEAEGLGNYRVNIFLTRRGICAVLRTIPYKIPTFADLGLPASVAQFTELGKGLVLVTGPTGSGKSTTLAAMVNHINQTYRYHILTVEDPVEFVHQSNLSLVNQREIGGNVASFSDALKYALREDPDVILVGEMRDLETISLALTAAETGHLVFGTLHTRGAASSVDRIIDSFPANQQAMIRTMLAESLAGVISQSLLKRADGKGRVAAYEILITNHAVSNLIREGKTYQITSSIQTGRKEGMVLMDQSILELVNQGVVTAEEAVGYMNEPGLIASKLGRSSGASKPPTIPGAAPKLKVVSPTIAASAPPKTPPKLSPKADAPRATPAPPMPAAAPPPPPVTPVASAPLLAVEDSGDAPTQIDVDVSSLTTDIDDGSTGLELDEGGVSLTVDEDFGAPPPPPEVKPTVIQPPKAAPKPIPPATAKAASVAPPAPGKKLPPPPPPISKKKVG